MLLGVLIGVVAPGASVEAEHVRRFRYRAGDVWRAAVRLVRVDYGFPIEDKDREGGYIVFQYVEEHRRNHGTIEVVEVERQGRREVLVRVRIEGRPGYLERMMADRLARKLRREVGPEPPAGGRTPPSEPPSEPTEPSEGRDDGASEGSASPPTINQRRRRASVRAPMPSTS